MERGKTKKSPVFNGNTEFGKKHYNPRKRSLWVQMSHNIGHSKRKVINSFSYKSATMVLVSGYRDKL